MKKKSFYFKDYNESEIIDNNKNSNSPKIVPNRVAFLFFIFFSLIFIFSIKIIYLSLSPEKDFFDFRNTENNFQKIRRNIIDRNGSILATNVDLYDVGLRPKLLNDEEKKKLTYFCKMLHL